MPAFKKYLSSLLSLNSKSLIHYLLTFSFIFLLPGQNDYQLLKPQAQIPLIRQITVELPPPAQYPVKINSSTPNITAKGVIVIDVDSGGILFQKNLDTQMLPASTTKIMTALVALESLDLNDTVKITQASDSIGHSMHLIRGEEISIKNLLYGILVESGNDAAFALSQGYQGGYSAFVKKMNQTAEAFNLNHTNYRNVSGVEQYNHLTTARDLSILAKEAMKNSTFAQMVATQKVTVYSQDKSISHSLNNINQLLGVVPGLKGIKTGWTEHAGECLVGLTQRDNHQVITVVLNSQDRFGETQTLVNWAFSNHRWQEVNI